MGFIINPYQVQPSGPSYGTLTTAWITATGETDTTILGALNTLESDLNTYGLTSKIKALYPFVGGTAAKHKYNFMDARDLDAAFRLVFNGGWTHSSTGSLPNGTNAYADTKLISNNTLLDYSVHLSYYSRTALTIGSANQVEMGVIDGSNNQLYGIFDFNPRYVALHHTGFAEYTYFANTTGLLHMNKLDNPSNPSTPITGTETWKNGSLFSAASIGYANRPTSSIWLGALNHSTNYWSSKECAFASIGNGFTSTEAANFYTAVQAFQTTLSRNV